MKVGKFILKSSSKGLKWTGRKVGIRGGLIIGGAATGAVARASQANPGLKRSAAKEGAMEGLAIGTGLALAPMAARALGKETAQVAKKAIKRKGKAIKGFFRRNGKVIPIFGK